MDAHGVRVLIISFLAKALAAKGIDGSSLQDDFDLRSQGIIDSLGFIALIAQLEAQTGLRINLADLEPERLMNLEALSFHIAAQLIP